ADRLLELVRIDVVAAADHCVLRAPREVEVAFGDVAEIPGVDPVAVEERGRRFGVAVVAARRGGPLELDASDAALWEPVPCLGGDAAPVARERWPSRDDRHRVRAGRGREGDALRREARAIDAIDEHATPPWREREIERAFREAVHRRERLRVEAVLRE